MSTPTLTSPAPCLPPPDRDRVVGILEAAAARLRDKGWMRGHYGPAEGPNCIMGAVHWAAAQEDFWTWGQTVQTVQNMLGRRLRVHAISWNDHLCPDAPTAIDTLLTVAKEVAGDAL